VPTALSPREGMHPLLSSLFVSQMGAVRHCINARFDGTQRWGVVRLFGEQRKIDAKDPKQISSLLQKDAYYIKFWCVCPFFAGGGGVVGSGALLSNHAFPLFSILRRCVSCTLKKCAILFFLTYALPGTISALQYYVNSFIERITCKYSFTP
jgi:hypothetical protein